ncbi:MAG: hypothetical protein ACLP1D_25490 [Xanthobacteraceae bacterium]
MSQQIGDIRFRANALKQHLAIRRSGLSHCFIGEQTIELLLVNALALAGAADQAAAIDDAIG